jgi:hypothetical protein
MLRATLVLAFLWLGACGQTEEEKAGGVYATFEVAAEPTEDEREFFGDEVFGKFDELDRRLAEEEGVTVVARLDLEPGGRFQYVGPLGADDSADARLSGTWSLSGKAVVLAVERVTGSKLTDPPKSVRLARERAGLRFPGVRDPDTGEDVLLPKRR